MKTWFKFYGQEFLSDPKMLSLSPIEKALWLTILCLSSASEEEGKIKYITEDKIRDLTGLSRMNDEWNESEGFLARFERLKMIKMEVEDGDDVIIVLNYEKRQEKDLTNAERQARFREKHNKSNGDSNGSNVTKVTLEKNRIEKNRIENNDRGEPPISPPIPHTAGSLSKAHEKFKQALQAKKIILVEENPLDNPADLELAHKSDLVEEATKGLMVVLAFFVFLLPRPAHAQTITLRYRLSSPLLQQDVDQLPQRSLSPTPSDRAMRQSDVLPSENPLVKEICRVFGKACRTAVAIAKAESGLHCSSVNWQDAKITGVPSQGIFQLNRQFSEKYFDCDYNIQEAYKLYLRRGFQPWSTYLTGSYKKYL